MKTIECVALIVNKLCRSSSSTLTLNVRRFISLFLSLFFKEPGNQTLFLEPPEDRSAPANLELQALAKPCRARRSSDPDSPDGHTEDSFSPSSLSSGYQSPSKPTRSRKDYNSNHKKDKRRDVGSVDLLVGCLLFLLFLLLFYAITAWIYNFVYV